MKQIQLISILILLFFTGCYSVKKMNTQIIKGYNSYPVEFTQIISNLLPVKEKDSTYTNIIYTPGDTIVKRITIKADCDSIIPDSNGKRIVYLKGENKYIHDTITNTITNTKTIENTIKVNALTNQVNQANSTIASKDTTIKIMKWSLIVLGSIGLIYFLLKRIPFLNKLL